VRIGKDDRTVFCAPEGGPLDYKNFRDRVWAPLLERTGPDEKHPKRVPVTGKLHMLRHSYATALIQSGENAKTVQTLMGHHSVAFTMDQVRGRVAGADRERGRGCSEAVAARRSGGTLRSGAIMHAVVDGGGKMKSVLIGAGLLAAAGVAFAASGYCPLCLLFWQ
jgi:hypothetical protein